jgi:hypothetical protein
MWVQAQNLVVAQPMDWSAPLAVMVLVGMLLCTAVGVLFETGAVSAVLDWLMGDEERRPAAIATTPQRSRA